MLIRWRIDDAVDAIPVHMINGAWGLIAGGLFASPPKLELAYGVAHCAGWFYNFNDGRLLAAQVCAVLWVAGWTFFTMFPFFIWLNYRGWLRADSLEELVGLDISYHGGMNSRDAGVKKEYVEAYNRHKGSIRNRRGGSGGGMNQGGSTFRESMPLSEVDPETDQEAAAKEALEETSER